MLQITIPESENWDPIREEFVYTKKQTLQLEHSLVSLSKWEAKYKKPFMSESALSNEELLDYIRFMTITQNVDPNAYNSLTRESLKEISDYINDNKTATTFSDKSDKKSRDIITSELIYWAMFANGIPISCEKWHLSRLLTLIHIFGIKNEEQYGKKKKMPRKEQMSQQAALNAARRAKYGSTG